MFHSQKIKYILPLIFLVAVVALLWRELFYSKPYELPSALIGENVPAFKLPLLQQPEKFFTEKNLVGHESLLNVWATWCYACQLEQSMLMKIKNQYHVPIYSIDYKDDPEKAMSWLENSGNPYIMTGDDKHGDTAIDLGVYGTPETFVINRAGKIIYRHIGVIDQQAWDDVLYPLIKQAEAAR